jgi:pimeloyl-ACP methyl ester carboxylesterase
MKAAPDPAAAAAGLTAMVSGSGPAVVLVHGSLGDYRQWHGVARGLGGGYTTVALSRRHHWPNPPPIPGAPYSYDTHREDLLRYLRLRAEPVHLVGHSYGAGVALLAALGEPGLVRTLTIVEAAFNSLLPPGGPGLAREIESRQAMQDRLSSLVAAGEDEAAARELIDWTQGGPGGFGALAPDVQRGLLDNASTVGPTMSTPRPHVTREMLGTLRIPTLVLRGERTRLYYSLIADAIAGVVPGARDARLPGAGHMTIVENPDAAASVLLDFLRLWNA